MPLVTTRKQRRELIAENAKRPAELIEIPRSSLMRKDCLRVFRSNEYLVQEFDAPPPAYVRLSVNRSVVRGDRWSDGISWEDLQHIKAVLGYGDQDAVEIYPADLDVVNVANMRHLWIMRDPISFAWRNGSTPAVNQSLTTETASTLPGWIPL